jgi:Gram-negative bacterial TonB protein C-terminal
MRLPLAVMTAFFALPFSTYTQEAPAVQSSAVPAPGAAPVTVSDYLRRAREATNIRAAGSTPFHMKVHFVASGNVEFTGEGAYEETWLAPDKWRREVSFGPYHAVEVQESSKHTFQASSDYEPKRLLLLMRMIAPTTTEDATAATVDNDHFDWNVEPGANRLVHIPSTTLAPSSSIDFNPDGSPSNGTGSAKTRWSDYVEFSGKAVARTISLTIASGPLLKINVVQLDAVKADTPLLTNTAPETDAAMTFRSLGRGSVMAPKLTHAQHPQFPSGLGGIGLEGFVVVDLAVDRRGAACEVEALYASEPAFIPGAVKAVSKNRFKPARLNGMPVEVLADVEMKIRIK